MSRSSYVIMCVEIISIHIFLVLADCASYNGDLVSCKNQINRHIAMKLMHISVYVLPKTRFIDLEYFVNIGMTENFNCVFLETIKAEIVWFLHGTL